MRTVLNINFYRAYTMLNNYKTPACQQGHTARTPNPANYDQLSKSIVKAIKYIETNLKEDFSLDAVVEHACLSKSHFCRSFKQNIGMTPLQYRDKLRIDEAKRRLEDGNDKITNIAYDCGYSSHHEFRRVFKVICKITPTEYRLKYGTK